MIRNAETFTKLYSEVAKDLYRLALYFLKNKEDAEDIVGEAVLDAYRQIESLREESLFKNWIIKILTNKCKMKLKDYALCKENPSENIVELSDERAKREIHRDEFNRMELKELLMELENEERFIICLSVFEGYKGDEIAELLGLKPATVRSKKQRALAKLANIIKE
ncbi:putative RNA polymerase sigma factor SigV [Catonella morbi ATCC 51271]|uniref:Putative RNA polymerase sigma factor SigV n=1 Tax=Catonella morbi ATCC 51271 TaxID=592026 RepID=V2Y723_9FIRM|nr:sigma-70 family RNA polymerase sigma factor [Catonella morbi]ESL03496.1 putative RNA polymerase sigma factor SigV [Catonella morbi ATCC 51271]